MEFQLYEGDCVEVMPQKVEAASAVVITDPPYSERVHRVARRRGLPDAGEYKASRSRRLELDFAAMTPELMGSAAQHMSRLAARWVLVFSDVESSHLWRDELTKNGLDYVRTGAWIRRNGAPQFSGDRPAVGFEAITICHPPGRKRWNGGGTQAVWEAPIVLNRCGKRPRVHTAQKPLLLMSQLVELFSDPGDLIFDPFMGSGTTGVAAIQTGRRFIGIERDPYYFKLAEERIRDAAREIRGEFKKIRTSTEQYQGLPLLEGI